jgi:hypothetical protein
MNLGISESNIPNYTPEDGNRSSFWNMVFAKNQDNE